jgi:hypothetical protein
VIVHSIGFAIRGALTSSAERACRLRHCLPAVLVAAAMLLAIVSRPSFGAPINYGSHSGALVDYINVTEDSTTGDSVPLFGPPLVSGNSIDFNPVGFDAAASGAGGNDSTGARLTFAVLSHPGHAVTQLHLSEAGDTTLAGSGTDLTSSRVTANGTITISHVDGSAITPIVRPIALSFTPSGGDYGLVSDAGGLPVFHTSWSSSSSINVAQILTSEGVPFTLGATVISLDLTNTLTATSEAGTIALINKQDFGGISITVVVPEPAPAALAALGLLFSIGTRRSATCKQFLS